jgi:hypothetical protein
MTFTGCLTTLAKNQCRYKSRMRIRWYDIQRFSMTILQWLFSNSAIKQWLFSNSAIKQWLFSNSAAIQQNSGHLLNCWKDINIVWNVTRSFLTLTSPTTLHIDIFREFFDLGALSSCRNMTYENVGNLKLIYINCPRKSCPIQFGPKPIFKTLLGRRGR